LRTVYLGTSAFAVAVLERLAESPHRPRLVVTRPDRPKGRGRRTSPPPVAEAAQRLGIALLQPEDLHAPEVLDAIAAAEADALLVCAYGALVKEPLLSRYEILNVHPSLLPRWRGAAPVERSVMAGDAETGVSIMRLTAGLDSGPVCLQEREPIRDVDDYGTLAGRLEALGARLLVQALDERPPFTEQPEEGVTYAEKIGPRDRSLDFTQSPEQVERVVRALRPHIGARIPLPDGSFLGVWDVRPSGPTLSPAGGCVRRDGDRLLLDCNGGALELVEVQPPGGRRMPATEWLRGRPDERLTGFWLDPTLPERPLDELILRAVSEWEDGREWAPHLSALCWRGSADVLDAMRSLATSGDACERGIAAYVLGQLGVPTRTFVAESAEALEAMAAAEEQPTVLATIAHAFGNLGDDHGTGVLLRLATHPDAGVREGVVQALAGREDGAAVDALLALTADPEPDIREWATFAVGALAEVDGPEIRDALAARLDDDCEEARVEAVHGLALRRDPRALETAVELLEAGASGNGHGLWEAHALEEAAIRLAALTGDTRLRPHLPEPDDRWRGTELGKELERALARTEGDLTA
jgi:methionyl-tRNA formyltransferase